MVEKTIIGGAKIKALFDGNLDELKAGYDQDLSHIPAIKFGIEAEEKLRPKGFEPVDLTFYDDDKLEIRARLDGLLDENDGSLIIWECKTSSSESEPEKLINKNLGYKYQICHYCLVTQSLYSDKAVAEVYYTVYNKEKKESKTVELDHDLLDDWCEELFGTINPKSYQELLLEKWNKLNADKPKLELVIYENDKKQLLKPNKLQDFIKLEKQLKATMDDIKQQILEYMLSNDIKIVEFGNYKFTLTPETTVVKTDVEKMEKYFENRDIEVPKLQTYRKPSIRITEKKGE